MQVRNWLYVEDFGRGIGHVLEHGTPGEAYNVGGPTSPRPRGRPRASSSYGRRADLLEHVTDRPGHDRRYSLGSEKVRALGWEAQVLRRGPRAHRPLVPGARGWWEPIRSGAYRVLRRASTAESWASSAPGSRARSESSRQRFCSSTQPERRAAASCRRVRAHAARSRGPVDADRRRRPCRSVGVVELVVERARQLPAAVELVDEPRGQQAASRRASPSLLRPGVGEVVERRRDGLLARP